MVDFVCGKEDLEFLEECNRDLEEEIRFETLKLEKELIKKRSGLYLKNFISFF